jgi:hypothetical protein
MGIDMSKGIDISKMKEKLASLNNRGGDNKNNFWRPQDGDTTIRIVPTDDGDPFKEYWFHYNVGNHGGFLCSKKNVGEDCSVCNFVKSLYNEGDAESIKMAKSLNARQRFFSPVVVRGQEEKGVQVWGFGRNAYSELLNLVLNPDYDQLVHEEEGTDIVITYGKAPGAQFPQTNITPRRRSSSLGETKKATKEFLSNIPVFDDLFEVKSATEVQGMLDEFLLGEEDAEETSKESTRYGATTGATTTTTTEASSVDQAFEELLG